MIKKLQRSGNSRAVILSKHQLKTARISEYVYIKTYTSGIVIRGITKDQLKLIQDNLKSLGG